MRSSSEGSAFRTPSGDPTAVGAFVPRPLPDGAPDFAGDAPAAPAESPTPDPESLREAAFEEGRRAGRSELPWQEARQLETLLVALESAQRAFAEERRGYLRAQRSALVELALELASRILDRELAADPDAWVALVERALDALPPAVPSAPADDGPTIRLAAADHAGLGAGEGEALARLAAHGRVVADPELEPGDVRVEAGAARVDARRELLLANLREVLTTAADAPLPAGPAPGDER